MYKKVEVFYHYIFMTHTTRTHAYNIYTLIHIKAIDLYYAITVTYNIREGFDTKIANAFSTMR